MTDLEHRIRNDRPRRIEITTDSEGNEIEQHIYGWPRPPRRIGRRLYWPEPKSDPY